jgi:hypothetical protein
MTRLFPLPSFQSRKGEPLAQVYVMGEGEKRLKSRCYGRIFPEPLLVSLLFLSRRKEVETRRHTSYPPFS